MGTKHKILEDFYDDWFMLIAIQSNQEDYALAYALNSMLKTQFKRTKNDIEINENLSIAMFEWFDEKTDSNWSLFPNSTFGQGDINMTGLFKDMPSTAKQHLVPEHSKVDYFIKIDQEVADTLVKSIQEIPSVMTAYMVDCDKLNSKNNLIF
ncbi:IPExxxVDY family protein [Aurantibacter crassamenti]|uniref:IPExxxVDY family protein n=1 Tax=Aurantibacter crassamenti TaxID=1837375 RepID=UPI001939C522|nr:IPExxxVDY family protein [Aurantibacter crassamenti]MBM1104984.1 IPExxxVDY family protein [Aurantibacter crassamenti]